MILIQSLIIAVMANFVTDAIKQMVGQLLKR